jgi:uncharacterized protein (TIGR02145 family)
MKKLYYLAILAVLFAACDKDGSSPVAPGEISGKIVATYPDSVIINGVVPVNATEVGICWDTVGAPTVSSDHVTVKPSADGKITATVHNLLPGQKYYVKIYANDNGEIRYSEAVSFETKPQWVNTGAASGVGLHQAMLNGTIDPIVSGVETTYWFEWGETSSYGNKTPEQTIGRLKSSTAVQAIINGLEWHKTYHFCLFVKTNGQIVPGRNCSFLTLGNIPTISEITIDNDNLDKFIIKATINPNLVATTATLEWGETNSYNHATASQTVEGSKAVQISFEIPVPERALEYHFRVKAENAIGVVCTTDTTSISLALIDKDGVKFHACKIGDQYWLTANWRVLSYNNGDIIPYIADSVAWGNQVAGALCFYDNNQSNYEIYGPLYNWFVISDPRGICPEGWHVPSEAEWHILCQTVEGFGGISHTEFTALPAGIRTEVEERLVFSNINQTSYFWTSTDFNVSIAWGTLLSVGNQLFLEGGTTKKSGMSIRLVKN